MSNPLHNPWIVDPWRFIKEQRSVNQHFDTPYFDRLNASVTQLNAPIQLRLDAHQDVFSQNIIEGTAATHVTQICQRCLEPFQMPLTAQFKWILARSDQEADELGDDAIVICEAELNLILAVEDELLLNLPIVPNHPEGATCEGRVRLQKYTEIETKNPFEALKKLFEKN